MITTPLTDALDVKLNTPAAYLSNGVYAEMREHARQLERALCLACKDIHAFYATFSKDKYIKYYMEKAREG